MKTELNTFLNYKLNLKFDLDYPRRISINLDELKEYTNK